MKYNENFNELLNKSTDGDYIGLGNPNSKILFIGKEPKGEVDISIEHGHTKSWKEKIDYSKRFKLEKTNQTWQRYQRLYEEIMSKSDTENYVPKNDKYEITFVENVFTTELSSLPAPNTIIAKNLPKFKSELEKRKENFFKSEFIKGFPIVIIFASDNKYIETYNGEVCDLFNVEFDHLYNYSGKDKIWIHYGVTIDGNPRLLIHTRQLANRFSPDLISSLSDITSNFIKENQIY